MKQLRQQIPRKRQNLACWCLLVTEFASKSEKMIPETQSITVLFTNMRILKFKSQLTIALFAGVNHLNVPLRKQNFTLTGSRGHGF